MLFGEATSGKIARSLAHATPGFAKTIFVKTGLIRLTHPQSPCRGSSRGHPRPGEKSNLAVRAIKPATSRANRAQWLATARFNRWPGSITTAQFATIQPAADSRTLSAQPHNPAQLFLPMPASRRKITVNIRGQPSTKVGRIARRKAGMSREEKTSFAGSNPWQLAPLPKCWTTRGGSIWS